MNNKYFVEFDVYFRTAAEGKKEQLYNIVDKIEITQNKPGVYHFKLYVNNTTELKEVAKIIDVAYCNIYQNKNYFEFKAG